MKALRVLGLGAMLLGASGTAAMDIQTAHEFIQGSWTGRAETWLFDGNRWQQFNGGTRTDTTFTIEALPENLFTVVSTQTGNRYVVHTNIIGQYMTWFPEGSTQPIGQYFRAAKD